MRQTFADSGTLWVIAYGVGILTLIVLLLLLAVFLHHFISDHRRNQNRKRFQQATEMLSPHLVASEGGLLDHVEEARRKYGDRAVGLVLRRARLDLRGEAGRRISSVLEQIGTVDELMKAAQSRKEWKRVHGVKGLGECGGETARRALMEAASDDSPIVRRAARDGLLEDGHPEAVGTAISSFLGDLPHQSGWRHAFYARIATIAPQDLLEMIDAGRLNEEEQKLALEALADAGSTDALRLSLTLFESTRAELRATAARAIGRIGGVNEIELALKALEDEKWFVRAAGARALETFLIRLRGEIPDQTIGRVAHALGGKLGDQAWWVRANAARALTHTGKEGVDALIHAAEGDDRFARDAALAALAMTRLPHEERQKVEAITSRLMAEKEENAGAEA